MNVKSTSFNMELVNVYKPIHHIFHTGESLKQGPSHLNFWLPFFHCVAENTLVLLRDIELYNWVIKHYPMLNVAFAKNGNDIDLILSRLYYAKYVYYSSNTGNVLHTLKHNNLTHVFLGHGDSDKSASAHKFFRAYDEIWVAGQAHIDRFANAGLNVEKMHFKKIGRPSLRGILDVSNTDWKQRMSPSVLYLPTWEGVYEEGNYSSVSISGSLLYQVFKIFGFPIKAKYHPATGNRDLNFKDIETKLESDFIKEDVKVEFSGKEKQVDQLIIASNIFICDISAVVSECLSANSPIFVYVPKNKDIIISSSNMRYEDYCYIYSSVDELITLMQRVIVENDDYLAVQRVEAMEYILSPRKTQSFVFENMLSEISNTNPYELLDLVSVRQ